METDFPSRVHRCILNGPWTRLHCCKIFRSLVLSDILSERGATLAIIMIASRFRGGDRRYGKSRVAPHGPPCGGTTRRSRGVSVIGQSGQSRITLPTSLPIHS